jgi:branched-chain amino acid transport system ATP-binding protein
MLEVEDIHTYYGRSHVLQGVSLTVPERAAIVVLGRNGVGKTTLVHSIIGFNPPRAGTIRFRGETLVGRCAEQIVRSGVGLVPQGRRIFPSLTVREQLAIAERRSAGTEWTVGRVLELFPALRDRLAHKGNRLSGGEQQMLAIARALVTNPALLLLDEPTEGLSPRLVDEVAETLSRLRREGVSLLLVEQNLSIALELGDRFYIMSKGRIVFEGPPDRVWDDEPRRYLGV